MLISRRVPRGLVELLPPGRFIDQVAHAFLAAKQVDKAIELFQFNVKSHPTSFNAFDSLAQAYSTKGEIRLAVESYQRSLSLKPDNPDARKRLDALRDR